MRRGSSRVAHVAHGAQPSRPDPMAHRARVAPRRPAAARAPDRRARRGRVPLHALHVSNFLGSPVLRPWRREACPPPAAAAHADARPSRAATRSCWRLPPPRSTPAQPASASTMRRPPAAPRRCSTSALRSWTTSRRSPPIVEPRLRRRDNVTADADGDGRPRRAGHCRSARQRDALRSARAKRQRRPPPALDRLLGQRLIPPSSPRARRRPPPRPPPAPPASAAAPSRGAPSSGDRGCARRPSSATGSSFLPRFDGSDDGSGGDASDGDVPALTLLSAAAPADEAPHVSPGGACRSRAAPQLNADRLKKTAAAAAAAAAALKEGGGGAPAPRL